jgi:hypothetical protein
MVAANKSKTNAKRNIKKLPLRKDKDERKRANGKLNGSFEGGLCPSGFPSDLLQHPLCHPTGGGQNDRNRTPNMAGRERNWGQGSLDTENLSAEDRNCAEERAYSRNRFQKRISIMDESLMMCFDAPPCNRNLKL